MVARRFFIQARYYVVFLKNFLATMFLEGGSTMVEQSAHNPRIKGSNPTFGSG
jgi:hypothetical protein